VLQLIAKIELLSLEKKRTRKVFVGVYMSIRKKKELKRLAS
jgi:hypothetical protein